MAEHRGNFFRGLRAAVLLLALALVLTGCGAKPEEVDPTPYLKVEFSGMSGEGTAKEQHNAILAPEDVTLTVEGLDEWVTALDQIGEADWSTLETYGESALRQREGGSITGADCLGGYLLVRQDFSSEMVNTHNILYVAYKVQAQLPDGSSLSYYAAIGFTDLVLHGDGSVEVTSDSGYASYGNIDVLANGEYYNFTGFETLEDMNKECIDGYAGMYAVESNVTEG